jgi:hypothetical protein
VSRRPSVFNAIREAMENIEKHKALQCPINSLIILKADGLPDKNSSPKVTLGLNQKAQVEKYDLAPLASENQASLCSPQRNSKIRK